ncbi:glycoside hydrolase family 97 N-terminal domain-containing protein [Ohtaekwangia kribbensis]|uniref:Glycoside hydrolase family 97 N-terminal domain-containing protein n=1 Tax=Ohtaekwangia kribbensis TaxID=688913 RepID=A0ABW3K5K6_9BACT
MALINANVMATCFDNKMTQLLYLLSRLTSVFIFILVMGMGQCGFAQDAAAIRTVSSPDGNLHLDFWHTGKSGNKKMYYRVSYKSKPVILESQLNIKLDNHLSQLALALKTDAGSWSDDMVLEKATESSNDITWNPLYGERSAIRDHYKELTLHFYKESDPRYKMNLVLRAYNQGVAFRYYFPDNPTGVYYRITSEETEFTFPANTTAWYEQWAQGPLKAMALKDWPDESERPLTLQLPGGIYTSLAEAAMVNYVRTKFTLKDKPNTIATAMYEPVDMVPYFYTPWRVIIVAEKPGDLIENNFLLLNLNPPSQVKHTGWIKPGKIIREMTLTNEGAKACIDFAAAHNLHYILFDWKWYGPAFTFDSDARKVAIDLDLENIIAYGNEKGIGIWLYVNQQALVKQDHELFPLYKSWGVKGVKYGFVQVGSHRWTTWLHESVQRAADNQLMVNIHDEFRTTGEQRTFPNILTAEGIRGNEEMPDATHNTILPFTRGIAGAGDYTICYYTDRIKTTHAHQLALGVVNYSPLQTLFWYDKPSDYTGEPEVEFFEKLPVTWDETRILQGEIGEYIITARRSGSEWFIGGITNNQAREVSIPLNFLTGNQKFITHIYTDDETVKTKTHVRTEQRKVKPGEVVTVKLKPSGGIAFWIHPEAGKTSGKDSAGK